MWALQEDNTYPTDPSLSRELILNHNLLRVLPFEIGKLFHLHSLGLHGNPLNKDVMSLYSEPSGTVKLLSYMLDNLSGEWGRHFHREGT